MIELQNSPLILLSSTVKSFFVAANGRSDDYDPTTIPLAADFEVLRNGEPENYQKDLLAISFDIATPDPTDENFNNGLVFSMKLQCVFSYPGYDDQDDPALKKEMNNFFLSSAVGIMLSSCRGYLNQILAHTLYSDYVLPAIDLHKFLTQKSTLAKQRRIERQSMSNEPLSEPATKPKKRRRSKEQ